MENLKIGIATLIFTDIGELRQATFEPATMNMPTKGWPDTKSIGICESATQAKDRADEVFATWFNQMSEIELADREQYAVRSKVIKCVDFPTGRPQVCQIEYTFEKI